MPYLHESPIGRKFLEGTMPRIALALEKLLKRADDFLKEDDVLDISQFKDPYIRLAIPENLITHEMLNSGPLNLTIQVELENEGVVINLLQGSLVVSSVCKPYTEMESGEEK